MPLYFEMHGMACCIPGPQQRAFRVWPLPSSLLKSRPFRPLDTGISVLSKTGQPESGSISGKDTGIPLISLLYQDLTATLRVTLRKEAGNPSITLSTSA